MKKILIISLINLTYLIADSIGCSDPTNTYYDANAEIGYFSGYVEGGTECNQDGWNSNYIGINVNFYIDNPGIFTVGNIIYFGEHIFYIDAVIIPNNCNLGVALIYIVTNQAFADGNWSTFEQGINWPFISAGSIWRIDACECQNYIDCNNVCGGTEFSCLSCSDGDFNDDDDINVSDIIILINCILALSICEDCYDINSDTIVNITDIVLLVNLILNETEGCLNPNACNYNPNVSTSCDDCCHYESMFYDCDNNCLLDENMDNICDNEPFEEFFVGMNLDQNLKDSFVLNALRFEEICHSNLYQLKNPLWTIYQTGTWPIYYHIESWNGEINNIAIENLTSQYEMIANHWLEGLAEYDLEAPTNVEIKVFGFVFNNGVNFNNDFQTQYGEYPIVTNYNLTNEQSPWEIRFLENDQFFNQNWYVIPDYLDLYVYGNRDDINSIFSPDDWINYVHPEGINQFVTKFWHKTTWDAVAQRHYLKIGGQISNYSSGDANYRVFAHEMGHCFFLDDIYDSQKYPDGQDLVSIMNNSNFISEFDKFLLRIVWKNQKLYQLEN